MNEDAMDCLIRFGHSAVCILRNEDVSKHIMDRLIRCGISAESNLRNEDAIDCLIRYGHSAVCDLI